MPDRDRDPFDSLLRQILARGSSTRASDSCVDGETLAAWTSGTLQADEASQVERHLADCGQCQAVLATLVRTTPSEATAAPPWRRYLLPVLVPLATAATVAIVVWPGRPAAPPALEQDSRLESAAEVETSLPPPEPSPVPVGNQQQAATGRLQSNEESDRQAKLAARDELDDVAARRERVAESARDDDRQANQVPAAALESRAASPEAPAQAPEEQEQAAPGARTGFALARRVADPREVVSADGAVYWRISGPSQVEVSATGGDRWQAAELASPDSLTAISAPTGSVCWVVGRAGAVYLSTDGLRFARLGFPERVDLVAVEATDASTAVVTAVDGRSWRTSDQGKTWR